MANKTSKAHRHRILKYGILAGVLLAVLIVIHFARAGKDAPMIQTARVERGTVTAGVSANGVIQPVTTVEVKSNVGGQVVELAVDEGDEVKAGQLIARIDPSDSISNLQQSQADFEGANAKVQEAEQGFRMQRLQTAANIAAAEQALETSRQRLAQAENQARVQPKLTEEAVRQSESNLASAQAALRQTKTALIPQKLAAARAGYDQAKAAYDQASNDVARKRALLQKGFVSKSQVDASEEQYSVAKAQMESAKSKLDTIKDESDQDLNAAEARVAQAKSALETAKANRVQDDLKRQDLAAARAAVKQAEANLAAARAASYQERIKQEQIVQARASMARSAASVKNAQTQLGYTTITAPRAGVVVKKYVEKGSIVTAGRSSFGGAGAGVTLVDVADTTRMMVQVNVDETDIAQVEVGQNVDISVDAYPGEIFSGKVTKIAPEAVVDQNVTTIPVTVEIEMPDQRLKPEMNATCDFIVSRKENVLCVPNEAVSETDAGTEVTVLKDGKQITRKVRTGIVGADTTQIISGLRMGETVVTAVIDQNPTAPTTGQGGRGMRGPRPF